MLIDYATLSWCTSLVMQGSMYLYDTLLVSPMHRLYFKGPDLNSFGFITLGFWKGKSEQSICSHLTSIPESHWMQHPDECDVLLQRHFDAFLVMVETALYVFMIVQIYGCITRKYFPDPLVLEIRALRSRKNDE